MKRLIAFAVCLLVLLVSCSGRGLTPTDILYRIIENEGNYVPSHKVYFNGADKDAGGYLDDASAELLYNGMSPLGLCSSFALLLPADDSIYEIHVYCAESEISVPRIKKILQRRIDILQDEDVYLYEDENYERVIAAARIFNRGRYVFLLVTDDNNSIEELLKKII